MKLDNLLVNDELDVKLADFGTSFIISDIPETNQLVSRFYRPPEIIIGSEVGSEADVWSAGVCLIELLTGKWIFDGENEKNMILRFLKFGIRFSFKFIEKSKYGWSYFSSEKNGNENERQNTINFDRQIEYKEITILEFLKIHAKRNLNFALLDLFSDLISKMLEGEPKKRISARKALSHPFFDKFKVQNNHN